MNSNNFKWGIVFVLIILIIVSGFLFIKWVDNENSDIYGRDQICLIYCGGLESEYILMLDECNCYLNNELVVGYSFNNKTEGELLEY